jgi:preprotein translocase subunit SecG
MFTFLLVVHAIIAALLVTVILMQRSEGGGLTSGGSPSGLMSARGAADFLTRSTAILATLFVAMSIMLAFLAATRHSTTIDTSLQRAPAAPAALPSGAPAVPFAVGNSAAPAPLGGGSTAPGNAAAPGNSQVPLAR